MERLPASKWWKLCYKTSGSWFVLARNSPVTYRIQCHAEAEPEKVTVDKFMPYQADFGEEPRSWLKDGESSEGRVTEIKLS